MHLGVHGVSPGEIRVSPGVHGVSSGETGVHLGCMESIQGRQGCPRGVWSLSRVPGVPPPGETRVLQGCVESMQGARLPPGEPGAPRAAAAGEEGPGPGRRRPAPPRPGAQQGGRRKIPAPIPAQPCPHHVARRAAPRPPRRPPGPGPGPPLLGRRRRRRARARPPARGPLQQGRAQPLPLPAGPRGSAPPSPRLVPAPLGCRQRLAPGPPPGSTRGWRGHSGQVRQASRRPGTPARGSDSHQAFPSWWQQGNCSWDLPVVQPTLPVKAKSWRCPSCEVGSCCPAGLKSCDSGIKAPRLTWAGGGGGGGPGQEERREQFLFLFRPPPLRTARPESLPFPGRCRGLGAMGLFWRGSKRGRAGPCSRPVPSAPGCFALSK